MPQALATKGRGCAQEELAQAVDKLGAKPDDLLLSMPLKPKACLHVARKYGVRLMTFDSARELEKAFLAAGKRGGACSRTARQTKRESGPGCG